MARPEKLTVEQVRYIVQRFNDEVKPKGMIKYKDVFEFQKKLYENNEILAMMDETFWRKLPRLGRLTIDEANRIKSNTVTASNNRQIKITNVVDAIYKHKNDPEALIDFLKPLEEELYSSIEREKKLVKRLEGVNQLLLQEKGKNKNLEETNENLQNLMYQLFQYSAHNENDIVNLMRTGASRHQLVNEALINAFSDPASYFKTMQEKNSRKMLKVVDTHKLEPNEEEKKLSILDEFAHLKV